MTIKEYLSQVQTFEETVEYQEEFIEKLQESIVSVSGSGFTERVKSSPEHDKIGKMISTIDQQTSLLEEMKENAFMFRFQVITQINKMDDVMLKRLLMMRYIDWKKYPTLHAVASGMGASYDYTKKNHVRALEAFGRTFTLNCTMKTLQ